MFEITAQTGIIDFDFDGNQRKEKISFVLIEDWICTK